MNMTLKISKEVYVNLILQLQLSYKLKVSRRTTLLLIDEDMLVNQLALVLDQIDRKTPRSMASDGIGDFGVSVKDKYAINSINKNQLVIAALQKLNKDDLVNFTFNTLQQVSHEKMERSIRQKLQRSNSVNL